MFERDRSQTTKGEWFAGDNKGDKKSKSRTESTVHVSSEEDSDVVEAF
jgi:hypothetical protein